MSPASNRLGRCASDGQNDSGCSLVVHIFVFRIALATKYGISIRDALALEFW